VNVLIEHAEGSGAPIVYEDNPTHDNLVGRVEHQAQMGTLVTNFMLIKAGAFHRANGGYLVLDALKILTQPFAWRRSSAPCARARSAPSRWARCSAS